MRTEKKESVIQLLAVQEAPWTYEGQLDDDTWADSDTTSACKILAACSVTAVLNITTAQFSKEPENRSCWALYPICDGWELQEHVRLPLFIRQQNPREICLLVIAILTCLHWSCMLSVFGQRRWKQGYLPGIIVATFTTLLPVATLVRDPTVVFLGLLPLVIDVYTSACLVFDYAYEKGKGLRSRNLG